MELIFYLAHVFSCLHTIAIVMLALSVIVLVFSGILSIVACPENDYRPGTDEKAKRVFKKTLPIAIAGLLITTFIPSRETYLFMIGGRVVDSAVSGSPEVKELPANTLNLLNEYIKQKTEDLHQAKEKKSQKKQ